MKQQVLLDEIRFRLRLLIPALLVGSLLVGPTISYLSQLAMFKLGFVSSVSLTSYLTLTLITGSIVGLIVGLVCVACRCQVLPCAVVSALLMSTSELLGAWKHYDNGSLSAIGWTPFVGIWVINTCAMGMAGYALAWIVNRWVGVHRRIVRRSENRSGIS